MDQSFWLGGNQSVRRPWGARAARNEKGFKPKGAATFDTRDGWKLCKSAHASRIKLPHRFSCPIFATLTMSPLPHK
jgi:hypothetical protein